MNYFAATTDMIKPNFKMADIQKHIEKRLAIVENEMLQRLHKLGQDCVNRAKLEGSYTDQTTNLRNSIGYAIIKDGQVINTSFGSAATATAQKIANARAKNVRKGYGLVVIAGMDYALHVEAQSYNVLSSAELFATNEMPKLIARMKKAVNK
jgi:hypothetical protein